jgi:Plavaka transposase
VANRYTQVPEDEAEKGKKDYVDFKREVWHESFIKLLETIAQKSVTGHWETCGDDIIQQLFPLVLILSADYEEQ